MEKAYKETFAKPLLSLQKVPHSVLLNCGNIVATLSLKLNNEGDNCTVALQILWYL